MTEAEIIALEDRFQVPTYAKLPIAIERGEGPFVWDASGRRYIDFYGGHCVSILGHSPESVVKAIKQQADTLVFYSNIVHNSTRARAAELVCMASPPGLDQVFFCNSGAEANETALKLARNITGKTTILAMEGGFHGRTLGSLSATHGKKYRDAYETILAPTQFVPFGNLEAVEQVLASSQDIAAIILEPIQSMAGMRTAPAEYFQGLAASCVRHGVLLVFDEVQTGCGRTGKFSYSEHVGVTPDMITLAKSLGSGVPVGATVVSDAVGATIEIGDHGTTFGGGMIAMAAVIGTLESILTGNLMARALKIGDQIAEEVRPVVEEVRGTGCLLGLTLGAPASAAIAACREQGLLVGGASDPNTIRLMPPVNCPEPVVGEAISILSEVLSDVTTAA